MKTFAILTVLFAAVGQAVWFAPSRLSARQTVAGALLALAVGCAVAGILIGFLEG